MTSSAVIPPLPEPGTKFPALPAALADMMSEERWLVWRWERHWKSGKLTKVPYIADAPEQHAKSNSPKTWRSLDAALAAYETGRVHGIGFALAGSSLGSFDLDDCRNVHTGGVEEWALALVAEAGSYAEVTTSGSGLRIIGRASGAKVHRNQAVPGVKSRIETYRGCERYIVMTGDRLPDAPDVLADIDEVIDSTVAWLNDAVRRAKEAKSNRAKRESHRSNGPRRDLPRSWSA